MSEEPPKQGNESAPSDRIESDVEPVTAPVIAEAVPGDSEAADAVRENLAAKEGKKTAATSVPAAGKGGNLTDKHEKHDDHSDGHGDHHENIWMTRGKYAVVSLLAVLFQIFGAIGDAWKAGVASGGGGGGGGGHAKKDDHGHGGGGGHH